MKLIPQMKLTDVGSDEATIEKYLSDESFVLQQKFDGTHAMFFFDTETHEVSWGNGSHSAAKLKHGALEAILVPALINLSNTKQYIHADTIILDGELLIRTGEYIIWDLLVDDPYGEARSGSSDPAAHFGPFEFRHARLEEFFEVHLMTAENDLVKLTPTAWFPDSKREMWDRIKATNVEGAVSKRVGSLYTPGVRSKDWLKHKLVKSADLVVIEATRKFKANGHTVERGSCRLGYVGSDGEVKAICSASLIGKDLTIEEGDVVEVHYLYRETDGGGLVQPRIIRKRWDALSLDGDKRPYECTEDQFPEYSRSVVTL